MNINVPFPHEYVDDVDYEELLQTIICPALKGERFLFVSFFSIKTNSF